MHCRSSFQGFVTALSGDFPGKEPSRPGKVVCRRRWVRDGGFAMRIFLGMILGALLLIAGVYAYDSQTTSTVANGQNASNSRTIVNWDVAATDWNALKQQAHNDWIRLSSR
jgi:hypothetical protein